MIRSIGSLRALYITEMPVELRWCMPHGCTRSSSLQNKMGRLNSQESRAAPSFQGQYTLNTSCNVNIDTNGQHMLQSELQRRCCEMSHEAPVWTSPWSTLPSTSVYTRQAVSEAPRLLRTYTVYSIQYSIQYPSFVRIFDLIVLYWASSKRIGSIGWCMLVLMNWNWNSIDCSFLWNLMMIWWPW